MLHEARKHNKKISFTNNLKFFRGLSSLKTLKLFSTGLNTIDSNMFRSLVSLEDLWLNKNNLTEIDDYLFSDLSNLKYLNLESNNLVNISKNAFRNLYKLEKVCLYGNPIVNNHQYGVLSKVLCSNADSKCKIYTTNDCLYNSYGPTQIYSGLIIISISISLLIFNFFN